MTTVTTPEGVELVDMSELVPCPVCNSLEQWQTVGGEWRCEHCRPLSPAIRRLMIEASIRNAAAHDEPAEPVPPGTPQCGRCGCLEFTDFPARGGEWIRQDCSRCGWTLKFLAARTTEPQFADVAGLLPTKGTIHAWNRTHLSELPGTAAAADEGNAVRESHSPALPLQGVPISPVRIEFATEGKP